MIRKPNGSDAKRLGTGVLVAGVVVAGAVALASPASAATTDATQLSIAPKVDNGATTASTGGKTNATYTISELTAAGQPATTDIFTPVVSKTGDTSPTVSTVTGSGNSYSVTVTSTTASTTGVTTTIKAANPANTFSASATFTSAATTDDLVSALTANPATASAYGDDSAPIQVVAKDANGATVAGATVYYQNADGTGATSCGATSGAGAVTCNVVPESTVASQSVTIYVNKSNGTNDSYQSNYGESNTQVSLTTVTTAVDDVTLTCPNQGGAGNGDDHDCIVPTGTKSVVFSALVENTPANSTTETPVGAGVPVNFSVTDGTGSLNVLTATTNGSGVATVTLTPGTTGDELDTVEASVDASNDTNGDTDDATAEFQTPAAQKITVTPGSEDVVIGSAVTETATITDQFGNPIAGKVLTLTSGSRNVNTISKTTTSTGSVTLSYTDTGTTQGSDTITASTPGLTNATYTVRYLTSVAPTAVALNFGGSPTSCPPNTTDPKSSVDASPVEVCAAVTNSGGSATGQGVTFTVSKGTVSDGSAAGTATSFTAKTNSAGIAEAFVYSTTPGAQTITATAGTLSKTLTDTYTAGSVAKVLLTPANNPTITPGQSQQFTATDVDQFGNPTGTQDYFFFTSTGPGTLNNNNDDIYAPNGTANVILSVASNTTTGSGTVSVYSEEDLDNESNAPDATVPYTVSTPVTVKSLSLAVSGAATIGAAGTATATVTGTDGKPFAAGEVVNFKVSGSTVTTGTGTTDATGVATFPFTAQHAGTFTVTATDSNTASATDTATGSTAKTEIQTQLAVTSIKAHQVRMSADTKPALGNQLIYFYSVAASGKLTLLGSVKGGADGTALFVAKGLTSGSTFKGEAKVNKVPSDYSGLYSNPKSVKVK